MRAANAIATGKHLYTGKAVTRIGCGVTKRALLGCPGAPFPSRRVQAGSDYWPLPWLRISLAFCSPWFLITVRAGTGTQGGIYEELRTTGTRVERLLVARTIWHSDVSRLGGWLNPDADRLYEFLGDLQLTPTRGR
jgi:hypothetical protein